MCHPDWVADRRDDAGVDVGLQRRESDAEMVAEVSLRLRRSNSEIGLFDRFALFTSGKLCRFCFCEFYFQILMWHILVLLDFERGSKSILKRNSSSFNRKE